MLTGFWLLKGWELRLWVNLLKKENSWRKSLFQIVLNEVLKTCEKSYLLMQKLVKTTRNKRSSDCILQIFIRSTFKLETQCKKFWLVFISILILSIEQENLKYGWSIYGQWCYHFKFLEEIRLHWLFHMGFGEIRFLKWHDVINSNSWFLAILKEFSGLPLFKLFFS